MSATGKEREKTVQPGARQPSGEPLFQDDQIPRGFRFSAVAAGIRTDGHLDMALAVADRPASVAAMFTGNRVVAAPLIVGRRHLERSQNRIRAVIVNSGNANCATGEEGISAAVEICVEVGKLAGCEAGAVLPSSTGIIGVPLPKDRLIGQLPALYSGLGGSARDLDRMARAIMTTDTRPKTAAAEVTLQGRKARIAGIAKGAGMIAPQLIPASGVAAHATMLVYLFTDAMIGPDLAAVLLEKAAEKSFNRISVDGDTSTNDTVLLMAGGESGLAIEAGTQSEAAFSQALDQVALSLAKQVVGDGEGAEHLVEIRITGAFSDEEALRAARSIAQSPLVKTSWAGCDPNWGRILVAAGYAGVFLDPSKVRIALGELELCRDGAVSPVIDLAKANQYLKQREITVHVDLGLGQGSCQFWTTDLTKEYVHINADYHT